MLVVHGWGAPVCVVSGFRCDDGFDDVDEGGGSVFGSKLEGVFVAVTGGQPSDRIYAGQTQNLHPRVTHGLWGKTISTKFESQGAHRVMSRDIGNTLNPYFSRGWGLERGGLPKGW